MGGCSDPSVRVLFSTPVRRDVVNLTSFHHQLFYPFPITWSCCITSLLDSWWCVIHFNANQAFLNDCGSLRISWERQCSRNLTTSRSPCDGSLKWVWHIDAWKFRDKSVLIALCTRNWAPSEDYGCASSVDGTWSMSSLRSSFRSEGNSVAVAFKLQVWHYFTLDKFCSLLCNSFLRPGVRSRLHLLTFCWVVGCTTSAPWTDEHDASQQVRDEVTERPKKLFLLPVAIASRGCSSE
jgi:hypothetical protein